MQKWDLELAVMRPQCSPFLPQLPGAKRIHSTCPWYLLYYSSWSRQWQAKIPYNTVIPNGERQPLSQPQNAPPVPTDQPHRKPALGPSINKLHRAGPITLANKFAKTAAHFLLAQTSESWSIHLSSVPSTGKAYSHRSKKPFKLHSIHSILILFCSLVSPGFQPDLHLASTLVNW